MKKTLILLFVLFIILGLIIGVLLSSCNNGKKSKTIEFKLPSTELAFVNKNIEWITQNGEFESKLANLNTNFFITNFFY